MNSYIYNFCILSFCFIYFSLSPYPAIGKELSQTHADLLLLNAKIYTMDACRHWCESMAISNGKIIFVGTNNDAVKYLGPLTKTINLDSKLVLPGFYDSHIHPIQGALEEQTCSLHECENISCIKETIKKYVEEHKNSSWIIGSGWSLPVFSSYTTGPSKELLDELCPEKPAYFLSQDGHSAWLNSKALEMAAITIFTPDPINGRIERKENSKEPSGTLREQAMALAEKILPKENPEKVREAALDVQKLLNSYGIISVQDACADEQALDAYFELDKHNLLTMMVNASLKLDPVLTKDQIEKFNILKRKYDGNLLRINSIKIFADGVIESKTAALLEPYVSVESKALNNIESNNSHSTNNSSGSSKSSESDNSSIANKQNKNELGMLNFSPGLLKWYVSKLDAAGYQLHIHAIGDRAVRESLNALGTAKLLNGSSDRRHHIAHLELVHPKDRPRFRDLNVIANFQPYWAFRDKWVSELTEPILGKDRSNTLYPMASLYKLGTCLAAGSDWTVSTANPLDAIEVAIRRAGPDEPDNKSFIPEESLNLPEILAAYTINGAYLAHNEKNGGSLELGKSADFIVLDKNIFTIPAKEIHNTKVLWTIFQGREVYRHPSINL